MNYKSVTEGKKDGYDYWIKKSKEERLEFAEFGDPYFGQTQFLGNIFHGCNRIWIDINGNIYKNKPTKKQLLIK